MAISRGEKAKSSVGQNHDKMKLAIVNCTTFFSANDGTARTHLFFKKILPLFFAVFFADDIEVFDGKTFPSLNNDPCAPMQ